MNDLLMKSWKLLRLGDIATISRGGSPRPIESYITTDKDGYNWLRIGDIDRGSKYITSTTEKIKQDGLKKSTLVNPGDFILSNSMSYGRPYIMKITACIHDGWLAIKDISQSVDQQYLFYLLSSEKVQGIFSSLAAGSGVQNLKKESVSDIRIHFPTIIEQKRIMDVLNIWDSHLDSFNKKIELKKKTKAFLSKQLLTKKLRLPGFNHDWEYVEIGSTLKYEQPIKYIVKSTDYLDSHRIPVLTAGKSFILGYTDEVENIYNNLPVIIFDDFTIATKFVDFPFKVKSSAMKMLTAKNGYNLKFLFERMQLINLSIAEHKRKYLSEYQYIPIEVPEYKEQTAIANILTTADQEIEALEKKRDHIAAQKKFLLNKLITGEIRLPEFRENNE